MIDGLTRMAASGYSCATILTHPAEFFRVRDGEAVAVRKNCKRFERVLSFLAQADDIQTRVFSEVPACLELPTESPPELRFALRYSIRRLAEQARDMCSARRNNTSGRVT